MNQRLEINIIDRKPFVDAPARRDESTDEVRDAIADIRNGQWRAAFILRFREALIHLRLLAW